jgi:uncharacterized protein (TIGR03435 family)
LRFSCIAMLVAACAVVPASRSTGQKMTTPSPAAAQPAPAEPAFDVAAIRENHSDHTARSHIVSSPSDGHLTVMNVPMKMLLQFAFALPETRILGGPDWLNSIKFDIEAKSDSSVDDRLRALNSDQAKLLKQKMVQALLADRFKLVCHKETRELPVYALVAAKGGPRLQPSKSNGSTVDSSNNRINIRGGDNTVSTLAAELSKRLGRVVIDKTGIAGRYDVILNWSPDDGTSVPPSGNSAISAATDLGPSIFTAIEEQLGLRLESHKGLVQVLVIDTIEKPSAN